MKVSVIIPVYNAARFLPSTIESVLIQEEVGEVLLINDASTDSSKEIILEYCAKDNRVRYFENEKNSWAAYSRNVGIDNATCEFISFLDADDNYLPNRFKNALDFLNENLDYHGTYEDVRNIKKENFRPGYLDYPDLLDTPSHLGPDDLFDYMMAPNGRFFHIISIVLRKSGLRQTRFDVNINLTEDIDFLYQLAKNQKLKYIKDVPKIERNLHDSNLTTSGQHLTYHPRLVLITKWYNKLKSESFSKQTNRAIVRRYLYQYCIAHDHNKSMLRRLAVKTYILIKDFFKYPQLLWRIM
jgi:glycosyltransferase involved in cell wall biosynthesis